MKTAHHHNSSRDRDGPTEVVAGTAHLLSLVYDELRVLARRLLQNERTNHTLQPTDLVHEAYLRLIGERQGWKSRAYFFAAAAQVLRRILVNHEEARRALKRGGRQPHQTIDEAEPPAPAGPFGAVDLLAMDDLLNELASLDARQSRIVELKFFGGLTIRQIAEILDLSPRTIDGEWALARAWLRSRLEGGGSP